jgi:DNA-binding response OmpR family regulator
MDGWRVSGHHDRHSMTPTARLLIIDDDRELAGMLAEFLRLDGFEVRALHEAPAEEGWAPLREETDLLILDVMLPGRSGFDVLRDWRAADGGPPMPVLMLTARGEAVDRILGLELGADDYLSKPFDPRELAARVRAILRRASSAREARRGDTVLTCGPLRIDLPRRRADVAGLALELTAAEMRVLAKLAQTPGELVERSVLTEYALGRPLTAYDRSVDTHISNVRRKLAGIPAAAAIELRSVRGAGYELLLQDPA